MGYYTDFKITPKGYVNLKDVIEAIEEEAEYEFDEGNDRSLYLNCKWYDWERDMKRISKKFPHVLFQVDGEGEENHDIWRCFFKAGLQEMVETKIAHSESQLEKEFDADQVIQEILTED